MVTIATGSITVNLPADLLQAIDRAVRAGIAKSRNELILLALGHELKACKHVDEIEVFRGEQVRTLLDESREDSEQLRDHRELPDRS